MYAYSFGLKEESKRYAVDAQIKLMTFSSSNYLDNIS